MFLSTETEKLDDCEFKWVKKKEDVQFYESFIYDGVYYSLYDCVYMHSQGENEFYIGKLVRIWENADKSKHVEVQWFFRPSDVSYYIGDAKMLENELLFASGDGVGVANINPMEAITGKCNVVCVSTDSRNPQPSDEELVMADYVFYRTFDVRSFLISDQMGEFVGGLQVKFVFNRKESDKTQNIQKLGSNSKDPETNIIVCEETLELQGKSFSNLKTLKLVENFNHIMDKQYTYVNQGLEEGELREPNKVLLNTKLSPGGKSSLGRDGVMGTMEKRTNVGSLRFGCKVNGEKGNIEDMKSPVKRVQVKLRGKYIQTNDLNDMPSKRSKLDTFTSSKDKSTSGVPSLTILGNDATPRVNEVVLSKVKRKPEIVKKCFGIGEESDNMKVDNIKGPWNVEDAVLESTQKLGENVKALVQNPSKTNVYPSIHAKNDVSDEKLIYGIKRSSTNFISPNSTPKLGCMSFEEPEQAEEIVKDSSPLLQKPLKTNDLCHAEGTTPKRVKRDDTIKISIDGNNNNNIKKLKKNGASETKKSPTLSEDDKAIQRLFKNSDELHINLPSVYHDKKMVKLSDGNLSKSCVASSKGKSIDKEVEDQMDEIGRLPIVEKRSWLRELTWEESVKIAHKEGRVVILQNLPPGYTSSEVEDIIYDAFKENGKARMVQHMAVSSPHSGQSLVIFKSVEAAERVVKKLDDGCLMLQKQRPLVGCIPKLLEKRTAFHGHFTINKVRRRTQREMKEAVSTAHFAQPNTIEYDMAMEWLFLQSKSVLWWERLYEEQEMQLRKLVTNLKMN
ncbi:hypothetical protein ACJIZ3_001560 [Penstemon smallii]|uniref:BAH domain-containing protein n=1 Tax=Penstemon smallii TaxID=265156 RepID=A0ABD3U426_9LAMI